MNRRILRSLCAYALLALTCTSAWARPAEPGDRAAHVRLSRVVVMKAVDRNRDGEITLKEVQRLVDRLEKRDHRGPGPRSSVNRRSEARRGSSGRSRDVVSMDRERERDRERDRERARPSRVGRFRPADVDRRVASHRDDRPSRRERESGSKEDRVSRRRGRSDDRRDADNVRPESRRRGPDGRRPRGPEDDERRGERRGSNAETRESRAG